MTIRRREVLSGFAGLTAAALLPAPGTAAPAGPGIVTPATRGILSAGPPAAAPLPAGALEARVAAARQAFSSCRYQALAERLPGLTAAAAATCADAVPGPARAAASGALARTYILVSELAVKAGQDSMARSAAGRAADAARGTDDPVLGAAVSRAAAIALRRLGRYDAAVTVLTRAAASLDAGCGDPPGPVLAAYGSLLCTAAYASAQDGRPGQALDLITEAASVASRMPDAPDGTAQHAFSPASVDMYRISIANAAGDSSGALAAARSVVRARLPVPERRAKFLIDTARAWHQHGCPGQAARALLAAERNAPEETRRPSFQALITAIAGEPGPCPAGLRGLASRAGTRSAGTGSGQALSW